MLISFGIRSAGLFSPNTHSFFSSRQRRLLEEYTCAMTVLPWVTVVLVAVGIGLVDSEGDFVLMCPEQSDLRNCIGEVLTGIPRGRFQNGWVACEVRVSKSIPCGICKKKSLNFRFHL